MSAVGTEEHLLINFFSSEFHSSLIAHRFPPGDDMFQDLRYGMRMLRIQPAFTLTVALTLALGIGANTAIFSFVDAALWRPLDVSQPERLAAVYMTVGGGLRSVSYSDYTFFRDGQQSLSGLAAYARVPVKLRNGQQIEQIGAELVTGNFFEVLGLSAMYGRLIAPADDLVRAAHPVAVISHRLWRDRFHLAPQAIGQTLNLNGQEYSIIGVAPAKFSSVVLDWGKQPDIWLPMMMQPQVMPSEGGIDVLQNRDARWLLLVGRLRDSAELKQTDAEMKTLAAQIASAWPQHNSGRQALVLPLREARFWPEYRREIIRVLTILQALAVLVLLVACFNVANLLLARATTRQKEMSIRLALGAGRWQLLRQWLTENLLLAVLAAGLGLLLARWLMAIFAAFPMPLKVRLAVEPRLDARVLGLTLLAAVLTSMIFSLALAWQTTKIERLSIIKTSNPGGAGRSIVGPGLVVAQLALSLSLLVGAGLLVRSLWNLCHIETGYQTDRVLLAQFDLDPREFTPEQGLAFYQQLVNRVRALPGVETASLTKNIPINPLRMKRPPVAAENAEPSREEDQLNADPDFISPGYFQTLGIRLLDGRDFDERDTGHSPRVVIINRMLAERLWPGISPVGKRLKIGSEREAYTVIAVAPNLKYRALTENTPAYYYLPLAQNYLREMTLQMRTTGEPLALAATLRQTVRELNPDAFVREVATLDRQVTEALAQPRMTAVFAVLIGGLALALASTGLYSVIAYSVVQRTREIGIRLALGATRSDVLRLIVKRGMTLAAIGVGVGLPVTIFLTRAINGLLYDVKSSDPLTLMAIATLLLMVALLATYLPARRATRVDPLIALRNE
jgi:predicted permease